MTPANRLEVRLTAEPRDALDGLPRAAAHPAAMRRRAAVLLPADADGPDAPTDEEAADRLDTSRTTAMRVRQPFAAAGSDATLRRKEPTGHRPPDPRRPVVCGDEAGKQPTGDARPPPPVRAGSPAREDSGSERHGTANLFPAVEPPAGRRPVEATDRRAAPDVARFPKRLLDEGHPEAERAVLVTGDPSAHGVGSRYEAFAPEGARRSAGRVEWQYTPGPGSRLDGAGIGLSVLARRCSDRRIPDRRTPEREVAAWQDARNRAAAKADWQFTADDARGELKKLCPTTQVQ